MPETMQDLWDETYTSMKEDGLRPSEAARLADVAVSEYMSDMADYLADASRD